MYEIRGEFTYIHPDGPSCSDCGGKSTDEPLPSCRFRHYHEMTPEREAYHKFLHGKITSEEWSAIVIAGERKGISGV